MRVQIGELLKSAGYINDKQLEIALKIKKLYPSKLLGEIIKDLYFVSTVEIAKALALQSNKEYLNLRDIAPSEEALRTINKETAMQFKILPFKLDKKLHIATDDPYNIVAFDLIKRRTNLDLEVYIAEEDLLTKYIQIYYFLLENPIEKQAEEILQRIRVEGINNVIQDVIKFIIDSAIVERASDIHITPQNLTLDVFFRVDGLLRYFISFPKETQQAIISRIKVMSNMDIAEQRLPQDGSFSYKFLEENYDTRVSTVPTAFGENTVIRILSKNLSMFTLENLGFRENELKVIIKQISKPNGILLITGPTGSGKSTTLYSLIRRINILERNVITVEDPIEYRFPFIKQTEVNEKIGYKFSTAIRSFLRQDPDVMLIGEIRDEETAEMAIRASITGHLVLSTLHTNTAIDAIPRLLNLGVDKTMLASSLNAIISQRLLRKLCPICKEETEYTKRYLISIGFSEESVEKVVKEYTFKGYRAVGCKNCSGTGYIGRKVISEIIVIDKEIASMITESESIIKLSEKAREKGMVTLEESGLLDILEGITTPEEVIRIVG
ncbi:GspE/PulE family protein [Sulfurihydrogenibium azorense]|uniref:GspE/PulE family protein n=1 Tax=Sulfurihydrogenibium azorense TaxID=309806 RepID=UPI0024094BDE|nr:GspE/PulE family protein [Sulfurihydrogenibium azorense]MDM7272939.1 GspE/PulE family protein [Sulfurihydrogenibium azorense]